MSEYSQQPFEFAPGVRRSDPYTSHMAAAQAKELAAHHHQLIVSTLAKHGPLGVTGISPSEQTREEA